MVALILRPHLSTQKLDDIGNYSIPAILANLQRGLKNEKYGHDNVAPSEG